jgi:hypothetical protein
MVDGRRARVHAGHPYRAGGAASSEARIDSPYPDGCTACTRTDAISSCWPRRRATMFRFARDDGVTMMRSRHPQVEWVEGCVTAGKGRAADRAAQAASADVEGLCADATGARGIMQRGRRVVHGAVHAARLSVSIHARAATAR